MSRDPYPPPPWAKVEIAGQIVPADVTFPDPPPSTTARNFRCIPDPPTFRGVVLPPQPAEITTSFDAEATCPGEAPIPVRAVVTWATPRRIFAALHPCGYLYALGDTEDEARKSALSRRDINRDEARGVGLDFPPPETDEAWSADLVFVTVSGTTKSLRVYVESVDEVIPWCPADLWDSGEVTP